MKSLTSVVFVVCLMISAAMPALAQGDAATAEPRIGLPTDWSHRHVVFSNSSDPQVMSKVQKDPRYLHQLLRRTPELFQKQAGTLVTAAAPVVAPAAAATAPGSVGTVAPKHTPKPKQDWSYYLGSTSGASLADATFPAKYSFDPTAAPSCANDFAVFAMNKAGATTQPSIMAFNNLYAGTATTASETGTFSATPESNAAITIVNGSNTLNLTTNATTASAIGTVAAVPTSTTTPSITITNSAGTSSNILTLTTNATTASAVGTVSGVPTSTSAPTITITNSAGASNNTLSLTTNATTASAIGTVAALPTSTSAAITITNSAGATANTLSLTTNATATTAAGTFSGTGPTAGQTISIKNSLASNTLVLKATANTPGIGTATFTGDPSGGDTIVIGGRTYTYHGSTTGCGATTDCIIHGGTTTQDAQNLEAAINDDSSQCGYLSNGVCFVNLTTANASVSATQSSAVVTATNITGSPVAWSTGSTITLSPATIPAPTATNSCTSASAGTYILSTTPATDAANVAAAINSTSCQTTYPVGFTASYTSGNSFTVINPTLGSNPTFTLAETTTNFAWGTPAAGSNGSNGCTSSTTGTFATSTSTTGVASNIQAAIMSTSCQTTYPVGVTASYTSGSTFTVTNPIPGPFLAIGGGATGYFTWGAVSGGSAGSNACTSSTSGTFATSNSTTTLASNIAAAINSTSCQTTYPVGVTATTSTNTFTVTNPIPGPFLAVGASSNAGLFSWGSVSGGSAGSNVCNSATSGNFATNKSTSTLASNIASVINSCSGSFTAVGVTASYTSGNTFTVTNPTPGPFLAVGGAATGVFTWGTVSGGSTGTNTCTSSTAGTFATSNNTTTLATNLAAAITACPVAAGVTATSSGAVVTVTARTSGNGGNSIATTSALPEFVWADSTLAGGGPYCSAAAPSVMWAYNATTTPVLTSPILSLDGTKIVFVEQGVSGTGAILHILRPKAGEGTTPSAAATVDTVVTTDAAWTACLATSNSCMLNLTFNNKAQDSNSSPYYTYDGNASDTEYDALYVGDDTGYLHKFTNIFDGIYGTPAEVITGGWPVAVHSGAYQLTGPVLDFTSRNIYVGDSSGQLSFVKETDSAVGACHTGSAPCLGSVTAALGGAIVDPPIVDSTTEKVFAFEGTDTTSAGTVNQFSNVLGGKVAAVIGNYTAGYYYSYIRDGMFDNAYFASTGGTGHLFVCGKDTSTSRYDSPALHRITITNGVMNSASDGQLVLTTASKEECSPVTEVYNTNTSTDWLFFSVGNLSNNGTGWGSCGNAGCLMSLNLTALGTTWPPTAITAGYATPAGPVNATTSTNNAGTSGIVMDNYSTVSQASSIYFTTQSATTCGTAGGGNASGCAVKLTQSALQ